MKEIKMRSVLSTNGNYMVSLLLWYLQIALIVLLWYCVCLDDKWRWLRTWMYVNSSVYIMDVLISISSVLVLLLQITTVTYFKKKDTCSHYFINKNQYKPMGDVTVTKSIIFY